MSHTCRIELIVEMEGAESQDHAEQFAESIVSNWFQNALDAFEGGLNEPKVESFTTERKEMLYSNLETEEIRERVQEAAKIRFPHQWTGVFYEHGQWWVRVGAESPDGPDQPEEDYSVVDEEGPDAIDGFGFERV